MQAIWGLAALWLVASGADAQTPAPPEAQPVAPGVWLIPGGFLPRREPDGNTIVLDAPKGLIVFDTGRHPWHQQAIETFARKRGETIAAIVNSHWHLDHTSGDIELRRAYPQVRVYASRAIEGALKGFLPRSVVDTQAYLDSGRAAPETAEDLRGDIAVIKQGQALVPDVPIDSTRGMTIAGRRLEVHLARAAATAGDVWIYDARDRIAIVGDLVTLPSPFLDTACPAGWRAALGDIWATPFRAAVPGHGPLMTRAQFAAYRAAFGDLIDCAATSRGKGECADDWTRAVQPMLDPGDLAQKRARGMTEDYVDLLRANGGKSPYCPAPGAA